MGTVAFVNFVRSVLLITWDDAEDCPRLMHAATNLTRRDDDLLVELVNCNQGDDDRGPYVTIEVHTAGQNVDADAALDRKPRGAKEQAG